MALDGTIIADITIDSKYYIHNDIIVNSDGNYVIMTGEPRTIDKTSVGGAVDALVVGDGAADCGPGRQ